MTKHKTKTKKVLSQQPKLTIKLPQLTIKVPKLYSINTSQSPPKTRKRSKRR